MRAHLLFPFVFLATAVSTSVAIANDADVFESAGVLDRPLPLSPNTDVNTTTVITTVDPAAVVIPEDAQENLRAEFEQEQDVLEQIPEQQLQQKADQGERAAQVVLAENFAKEAIMLSFAPVAANDALSDAVEWYSRAAMRGFPGAPSLDQAGVKFYPVRVHRVP